MNNFWQRLTTGALFTGLLVCSIILSGWYLHLMMGLLAFLSLQEFYKLFEKSAYKPDAILGPILGVLIYSFFIYDLQNYLREESTSWTIVLLLLSFPLIAISELYRKKKTPFQNMGITILGIFYLLTPFVLINLLAINPEEKNVIDQIWPVLAIFLIVWSNDTFAYLIGKQWGKRRLFERISPKKSWEGFWGGFLFAIICGNIIAFFTNEAYVQYTVYAIIISVMGTIGDLIESMLKRSLNVKDSGKILPGHGGILDRLDAVLFAIPFIYICHFYLF
ncbi:MAG: phosphatidate cytidylyltransferase [Flavobacteriales bacterium]|nr:phosphatidate cytidylyltransferase [Flavobacteriales bacterium]